MLAYKVKGSNHLRDLSPFGEITIH